MLWTLHITEERLHEMYRSEIRFWSQTVRDTGAAALNAEHQLLLLYTHRSTIRLSPKALWRLKRLLSRASGMEIPIHPSTYLSPIYLVRLDTFDGLALLRMEERDL